MDFDLHFEVSHFLPRLDPNLEFVNGRKLADEVFNGRGIDIHTANRKHVIGAPEQAAIKARKRPSASTRAEIQPYQIAGAITNHRESRASQIGDDQLPSFTRLDFFAGLRIDHFGDKLALDDVNSLGLKFAFEAMRAYFRSARVVEALRMPRHFNARLRLRHVRARLSRVDQRSRRAGPRTAKRTSSIAPTMPSSRECPRRARACR